MISRSHALLLEAAASAAEELTAEILSDDIFKAVDPLSKAGFLLISKKISQRLAKAAGSAEAQVVKDVLDELDFDWAKMSAAATDAALKAIRIGIATKYDTRVMPKVGATLKAEADVLMRSTKAATLKKQKSKASPALIDRDRTAAKAIRKSNYNFIRRTTGERARKLSKEARKLVSAGLLSGHSTKVIAKTLKDEFSAKIPRPDVYWRVVADAFVGRARAASQILTFDQIGVTQYELVAILDEVTSDICRFMDGKVFEVSAAMDLVNKLSDIEDPDEIIYTHPWVRKGFDPEAGRMRLYVPASDGSTVTIAKIERSGVGKADDRGEYSGARSDADLASLGIPIPPFHGRCRTVIVAH